MQNQNAKDEPFEEEVNENSMTEVANFVLESLEEGYKTEGKSFEGESFEVYSQKLRSHIHTDPESFKHRFMNGYSRILDILKKT